MLEIRCKSNNNRDTPTTSSDNLTYSEDTYSPLWGRTRRVTRCRDARECRVGGRPLCQRLQHRDLTTTDAQIVRPYRIQSRLVSSYRASLQRVTRQFGLLVSVVLQRTHRPCVPTKGYTSRLDIPIRSDRQQPTANS